MKIYLKSGKTIKITKALGESMINQLFDADRTQEYIKLTRGIKPDSLFRVKDISVIK